MRASSGMGTLSGRPNRLAVLDSTKRGTPWRMQASTRRIPSAALSSR